MVFIGKEGESIEVKMRVPKKGCKGTEASSKLNYEE